MTIASVMEPSGWRNESITDSREWSAPLRSDIGLRFDEHETALGAATTETEAGNGEHAKDVWALHDCGAGTRRDIGGVTPAEAASGACKSTMKYPESSSGTKLVGTDL